MNINWSKFAKAALGIGGVIASAICLLHNLKAQENKEEVEDEYDLIYSSTKPKEYRGYVPSGCRACGGPYPMCRDGCNMFDD